MFPFILYLPNVAHSRNTYPSPNFPYSLLMLIYDQRYFTIYHCVAKQLISKLVIIGALYLNSFCFINKGHRAPITSKLSVSQNSRGATQMAVSYERSSSPPNNNSNSRRSSGASINGTTTPSRKNSITGLGTTSCLQSNSTPSPHDSGINRFRPRQRSPSPSNK